MQRCGYCRGTIDPRYYFCVHCSRPHREPDAAVYEEEPPIEPGLQERLSTEGRPALNLFCILAVGLVIMAFIGTVAMASKSRISSAVNILGGAACLARRSSFFGGRTNSGPNLVGLSIRSAS